MRHQSLRSTATTHRAHGTTGATRPLRALSTTAHVLMAGSLLLAGAALVMPASAATPVAAEQSLPLSIPAGPLDQSLNRLAASAHRLLVVDPALLRGRQAPAVEGNLPVSRALEQLLSGSGLVADQREDGSIHVRKLPAQSSSLPALTVVATSAADPGAGLQRPASSGALGSRSLLETPFSITVVDKDDIQERQVTTVEQAFRYDPSVTSASGEYGRGSSLLVRGLGIDDTNGFKMDGLALPGWGNDLLPMEVFERVELLKGLSGFMYGFGSPGGIMNYVLKRPTDENLFAVDVGYKTGSLFSKHIDIGGRAGDDQRLGYRINLVQEQGGTYFKGGSLDRTVASLATDLRLTQDLKLSFDTVYARRKSNGNAFWGMSLSSGLDLPTAIDPRTRQQPEGAYFSNENIVVSTGLEWQLNPDWKSSFNYRYAREDVDYVYGDISINDALGNSSTQVYGGLYSFQYQQLQAMLEGKLKTGAIGHQLVFGASRQQYEVLSDRASTSTAVGSGNIYRDSLLSVGSISNAGHSQYRGSEIVQNALFASDTLSLGEQWSLIGGLRYTRFDQRGYNRIGVQTTTYQRSPVTPTVALMFKPLAGLTTYVSYVEALERGGTAGDTTANAGEVMPPLKSKQIEAGVKVEQANWSATAAVFRMQRAAEYVNAANTLVQDGETRYQGLDLSGRYALTPALNLEGGLMWLDAKYQSDSADLAGKQVVGAPRMQATAGVRYRVAGVAGLSVNGGLRHVGRSKLDTGAPQRELSAYTVMDVGAVYRTRLSGKDVTFNAQVQNLADRRYWVYNGDSYIFAGAPRTLSLNARVEF
ncbi:TonB-dependent siderophore receptor [Herbaspirillum frisingense]|uniref:Iron complex outermembrane receptor protein n=1 Tax=Herbaspirillum frisingense TaxID=92645 RepID=A0ABU1P8L8_9BURK|nr:TonB-dependent receptor [Herbaspirillum frisingense]MDR6582248.1 iron complex outermembrane receptor protein [Herbaspirillum frisingense]